VFGKTPVIPHVDQVPVAQARRQRAMHTAKAEYEKLLAESRIQTALRKKLHPAADYVFNRDDGVYVYQEGSKSWTGPHQVAAIDSKCAYVHLGEQFGPRAFNTAQLQPAITQKSQKPANSIDSVPLPWSTLFPEIIAAGDEHEALFDDAKRA
jgi:hypothetical protein